MSEIVETCLFINFNAYVTVYTREIGENERIINAEIRTRNTYYMLTPSVFEYSFLILFLLIWFHMMSTGSWKS